MSKRIDWAKYVEEFEKDYISQMEKLPEGHELNKHTGTSPSVPPKKKRYERITSSAAQEQFSNQSYYPVNSVGVPHLNPSLPGGICGRSPKAPCEVQKNLLKHFGGQSPAGTSKTYQNAYDERNWN